MRFLGSILLILASPAIAQVPGGTIEAMRRDFPQEHAGLAADLAGKSPEDARRAAYGAIDRFLRARRDPILAAPASMLVSIEARQAALLRALAKQDVALCAAVGDRGFFSSEALGGPAPAGLDDYGVALIEAAKAGAARSPAAEPATKEDFLAWLDGIARIEPDVPVRDMLVDRAIRPKSSADHICRGAAAMHEAVAALPSGPRERIARAVLKSVIGSPLP